MKKIDIICAGEILGHLVGTMKSTKSQLGIYDLLEGGSPANLANNLSFLGNKVALIASVGNDDVGKLLIEQLKRSGVNRSFVKVRDRASSLVVASHSKSEIEAYRSADCQITLGQLNLEKVKQAKVFHTTCFGLSKEPARSTILACAEAVHDSGGMLSLHLNYRDKVWPKRKKARRILEDYMSKGALVRLSDKDYLRLYGKELKHPEKIIDYFLNLGVKQVCLMVGDAGVWVANKENETFLPVHSFQLGDTTGAGDAFWAGYLTAWLKGKTIVECAKSGRTVAEIKRKQHGAIRKKIML